MRKTLAALSAAALLALAGCGNSDSTSSGANYNDADVTFAQQMIPHHEQAVEMAKLAAGRAKSQEVKDLAAAIEAAQGPEIATMSAWLKAWGQETSGAGMDGMDHGGMDHGGMDGMDGESSGQMQGMMSDSEMSELEASSGADFDTRFLTMMIAHHEGAIAMAKVEQADGRNSDAKELAGIIIEAQTREIALMRSLLSS